MTSRGSVTRKRVEIAVEHLEFRCHHDRFLEVFLKAVLKEVLHNHIYSPSVRCSRTFVSIRCDNLILSDSECKVGGVKTRKKVSHFWWFYKKVGLHDIVPLQCHDIVHISDSILL